MLTFYSCSDYLTALANATYDADAPSICAELEEQRDDTYAVIASQDGRIVADAEGWRDDMRGTPPYDAATATGMYDAW